MSAKLTIFAVTGQTPFDFYICDVYENNCSLIATITGASPTQIFTLPTIFNNAPAVMVKMIDGNDCEIKKTLTCDLSCGFEVIINTAECDFCFQVEVDPCGFGPYIELV